MTSASSLFFWFSTSISGSGKDVVDGSPSMLHSTRTKGFAASPLRSWASADDLKALVRESTGTSLAIVPAVLRTWSTILCWVAALASCCGTAAALAPASASATAIELDLTQLGPTTGGGLPVATYSWAALDETSRPVVNAS